MLGGIAGKSGPCDVLPPDWMVDAPPRIELIEEATEQMKAA